MDHEISIDLYDLLDDNMPWPDFMDDPELVVEYDSETGQVSTSGTLSFTRPCDVRGMPCKAETWFGVPLDRLVPNLHDMVENYVKSVAGLEDKPLRIGRD